MSINWKGIKKNKPALSAADSKLHEHPKKISPSSSSYIPTVISIMLISC